MDVFEDITEFHKKFDLMPTKKGLLEDQLFAFRMKFLSEELDEQEEAHDEGLLPQALDANIDLIYVALGNIVMMGFNVREMREAWRRVHEANMKKVRARDAEDSRRKSTWDVVKPKGWEPPDLTDLCA